MEQTGREATTLSDQLSASAPLAAMIDEYSGPVYRLARSIVGDPGASEDVAQETFIKVWKHRDEFRGDGSMRGWVLRIAHREAIAVLRRRRDLATDPDHLPATSDPIGPSRIVEGRLAYDDLMAAMDELDVLSRSILVLREIEGLSYDEIATALEVSEATVKTRLLRSRRQMAGRLEGWRR